jgi:L-threonylcarbamoyladenylate synthase
MKLLKQYWPGSLTVILPKKNSVSTLVAGGHRTVAVRWPKHKFVVGLLKILDSPIVSTSANLSGQSSSSSASEVIRQFRGRRVQPDLVIDAGRLPDISPSTIIKFTGQRIIILRQGSLHIKEANAKH